MMRGRFRVTVSAVALVLLVSAAARADVVVRVEVKVKDPNQKADAATALSVETIAGATGQFSSKTKVGKQTVELKGNLKRGDDGAYLVRVSFSDHAEGSSDEVTTNMIVAPNKSREMGGLARPEGQNQRTIVLTLEDKPAK